jgi:hypothetical protein
MAGKLLPFDEYATKLYEPTKHETRMLVNIISGSSRFCKSHKPQTWADIMAFIKAEDNPHVTKGAFRNLWLAYGAYKRRTGG